MAGFLVNVVSLCFSCYLSTLNRFSIAARPGESWPACVGEANYPGFYPITAVTEGESAVCAGAAAIRLVDDAFAVVAALHVDTR